MNVLAEDVDRGYPVVEEVVHLLEVGWNHHLGTAMGLQVVDCW